MKLFESFMKFIFIKNAIYDNKIESIDFTL